jgi:hypothetical protein
VARSLNIGAGVTMRPNVHDALDGDLNARALATPERVELIEARSQIGAVLSAIPVQPLPDLSTAVLARIRRESSAVGAPVAAPRDVAPLPNVRRTTRDWLWQPRAISVTWRPAYALAAAAVFAAVIATNAVRPRPDITAAVVSQQVLTQFVLSAPNAKRVAVAGDFSNWQPVHVMTRSGAGVWTVVVPLDPGVHDYAFVVDGERWVPDPSAPAVNDGFGGVNSRLAVLSPDGGRS